MNSEEQHHLNDLNKRFWSGQLGFCRTATLTDVQKNDYVVTPGRYVGAAAREEDEEPFEEKMARLTATLREQSEPREARV